jgi:hypothetical protein
MTNCVIALIETGKNRYARQQIVTAKAVSKEWKFVTLPETRIFVILIVHISLI